MKVLLPFALSDDENTLCICVKIVVELHGLDCGGHVPEVKGHWAQIASMSLERLTCRHIGTLKLEGLWC